MINLKAFHKLVEQLELDTSWKEKLDSSEDRKFWEILLDISCV